MENKVKALPATPLNYLTRVCVGIRRGGEVVSFNAGDVARVWLASAGVVGQDDGLLVVHVRRLGPRRVGLHLIHQHFHPQPARRLG